MIHQLGASMIDEDNYKAALETTPSHRAFQYLQDWAVKYRLGGPQYTASRTDFLAGKLATECSFGIWGIPQMQAAGIDWTVMPAPRWADAVSDNGLDIYAYYMMVNARSAPAAQRAAWKLARFYTDHAAELFSGAGLFVPRAEVTESAAYKENPAAPFFLAELKKAKFSPRVVGYTQVLDTILRGKDKLVQGEKIDDVLPIMNEEVNAVMNRERARASTLVK
jgi:maltose-binding protein MalE